jgi:hypothetical protein
MKCAYCNQEAEFQLKNGKWCCSRSWNQCPELRKRNSLGLKLAFPDGHQKNIGHVAWNKGLTKETDERVRRYSTKLRNEKISKSLIGNLKVTGKASTPEKEQLRRQKISQTCKLKGIGGYRENSGRCRKVLYKNIPIQGSYEFLFLKFLDRQKILWNKNKSYFKYDWQNKSHKYLPDFYLPEFDCYIEVKGYVIEKDIAKWSQFPHQLFVVTGKELGINIKPLKFDIAKWKIPDWLQTKIDYEWREFP